MSLDLFFVVSCPVILVGIIAAFDPSRLVFGPPPKSLPRSKPARRWGLYSTLLLVFFALDE